MFDILLLIAAIVWIGYLVMKVVFKDYSSSFKAYLTLEDLHFPDLATTKDKDIIWHIKQYKDFTEFWWKNIGVEAKSKLSEDVKLAALKKVYCGKFHLLSLDLHDRLYWYKFPDLRITKDEDILSYIGFSSHNLIEYWWNSMRAVSRQRLSEEVRKAFLEKIGIERDELIEEDAKICNAKTLISLISSLEDPCVKYWWENISDEIKSNFSEEVKEAFLKKAYLNMVFAGS